MRTESVHFFRGRHCDFNPNRMKSEPANNELLGSHKSQLPCIKKVFAALLVSIVIVSLSGCDPDPVEIALKTTDWEKGIDAVEKLTDQAQLAKVAVEAENSIVREAAIERLTDQALLGKIALKDKNKNVRKAAFERLTNKDVLTKVTAEREEREVQLLYIFIRTFDSVPEEHRTRLMADILPAIRVLSDTEVVQQVGQIVYVQTDWSSRSAHYTGSLSGTMYGEWFSCSIGLKKLTLSHSWSTEFPYQTGSLRFRSAEVNYIDVLRPAFKRFSQILVEPLIGSLKDEDWVDRKAAAEVLGEIKDVRAVEPLIGSLKDENRDVRKAAAEALKQITGKESSY